MTAKEVILQAIRGERPPRVAVALLSAGAWTFNQRGFTLQDMLGKPEEAAEIIGETSLKTRSDIVWPGSGYHNLVVRALGGAVKFRKKGTPDVLEPLLEKASDAESVDLSRIGEDEGIAGLWETAALVAKSIGDERLVGSSQWGPFTLAGQLFGVEKLMRAVYRDPAAVHAVVSFAAEVCYQYLVPYVRAGAEIISVADPTASGDMISRSQFEQFVYPHLSALVRRLHGAGTLVAVHICGNITNRLDLLARSGADLISVDYKVDLQRVKAVVGQHPAFAGNLNPVAVMQQSTPEQVAKASREAIAAAGEDGNYVLMPGCDIPPGVPIENIQAMAEVALNWRLVA